MITKVLFVGGALLVGLACLALILGTLIYLAYCLLAPCLQKRRA
jgi:hypothetical protein